MPRSNFISTFYGAKQMIQYYATVLLYKKKREGEGVRWLPENNIGI